MQSICKRDSGSSSAHLGFPVIVVSSSENSTESHVHETAITNSLSLKMGGQAQHCHYSKQLSFQFHDQDSSSSQSTDQSQPEVASMKESNTFGQGMVSSHSGQ